MSDPLEVLDADARAALRRRAQPDRLEPMLARLSHEPFSDPGWIFERKLDGERCLAHRKAGRVRLLSRSGQRLEDTYPEIAEALEGGTNCVLDGEVVAFDGRVTSFSRLQQRMQINDPERARRSGVAVTYYAFDLLHWGRHDLTGLPQRARKECLRRALDFRDPIRYTPHRNEAGEAYLAQACRKGWEGIIAKDAGAGYVHGRSAKWKKLKCVRRQEFVLGGFTEPSGERIGFGALLVGFFEHDSLRYAGKVGTGYDDDTLKRLRGRLDELRTGENPFADEKLPTRGAHWVRPKLVAEIGYTELTRERRLRHPRFLGLRRDKDPRDVHLEEG